MRAQGEAAGQRFRRRPALGRCDRVDERARLPRAPRVEPAEDQASGSTTSRRRTLNLPTAYWSQTSPDVGYAFALTVAFSFGYRGTMSKASANWLCCPVHDDDVAALPQACR